MVLWAGSDPYSHYSHADSALPSNKKVFFCDYLNIRYDYTSNIDGPFYDIKKNHVVVCSIVTYTKHLPESVYINSKSSWLLSRIECTNCVFDKRKHHRDANL
ncbi:unnamed protein product [Allacma fusca]|uniref:Uncharacterized protein n=1 Tax=Allacma fusca TaxID=39272 RepID=A0A8J2LMT9_9HEXA|nr:unnamed protein product [Allacma fusca]